MNISWMSETGAVRSHNEDRFLIDEGKGLFVLADGMGGHQRGDVAASMAVDTVKDEYSFWLAQNGNDPEMAILKVMNLANIRVYEHATSHADHLGMGTTLSMVYLHAGWLYYGHIGDSRIYMFRDGQIEQLTRDHTMVEELVETGTISSEQAKKHPRKNILLKALGTQFELNPDIGSLAISSKDILIMMTDGVYEYIEEAEMATLLQEQSLDQAKSQMDYWIRQRGSKDNYTLLLIEVGE